ncbi:hypothetical protein LLG96_17575 [bacterium]|nr:hypothetical protein [bacterium]
MPAERQESVVRILFTNNSNGKLENCHCRNDYTGGLAERVGYLRTYRKEHPDILLLDSGGYLGLSAVEKKGPIVFKLMNIMNYDGWGIGDQELYGGFKQFMSLFGEYTDRIINASLVDGEGKPVFREYRIFTVGDVRIGVTGLFSADTFRFFPDTSRDFTIESPDVILGRLLPALRDSCDYIVVLSQMGKNGDVALAEKWPDIDLIIGGHSQTLLTEAITVSGCRIVQAGKGGGRIGEVVIRFDKSGKVMEFNYRLIELDETYTIPDDMRPVVKQTLQ